MAITVMQSLHESVATYVCVSSVYQQQDSLTPVNNLTVILYIFSSGSKHGAIGVHFQLPFLSSDVVVGRWSCDQQAAESSAAESTTGQCAFGRNPVTSCSHI